LVLIILIKLYGRMPDMSKESKRKKLKRKKRTKLKKMIVKTQGDEFVLDEKGASQFFQKFIRDQAGENTDMYFLLNDAAFMYLISIGINFLDNPEVEKKVERFFVKIFHEQRV